VKTPGPPSVAARAGRWSTSPRRSAQGGHDRQPRRGGGSEETGHHPVHQRIVLGQHFVGLIEDDDQPLSSGVRENTSDDAVEAAVGDPPSQAWHVVRSIARWQRPCGRGSQGQVDPSLVRGPDQKRGMPGQRRQHTGEHQRRLARSRRTDHGDRPRAEAIHDGGDLGGPPEEGSGIVGLVGRERSIGARRPCPLRPWPERQHIGIQCRVVGEDRPVHRHELGGRLEPELVAHDLAGPPVGLQRVGTPAAAVLRPHQLGPQPVAQRLLRHQRRQLRDEVGVPPQR
jgi:hypothetical protein